MLYNNERKPLDRVVVSPTKISHPVNYYILYSSVLNLTTDMFLEVGAVKITADPFILCAAPHSSQI